jgi:hypothetical protein
MASSPLTADSLLTVDIGSVETRALLFDIIEGRYRFVATGSASTTLGYPFYDPGEGVSKAINHLTKITGRKFLDKNENLIIPTRLDNSGIDSFTVTMSAGPPLKVIAVGLVQEVSVQSACHLAESIYSRILSILSLDDRRNQETRIDTILKHRPDLIIIAGGIEGGASHSIRKMLEAVELACSLMPRNQRPQIIYAGNKDMQNYVRETLSSYAGLHMAPNIRPSWEIESLGPAQMKMVEVFRRFRTEKNISLRELDNWSKSKMQPTSLAFGRIIKGLSKIYDSSKGVLGVDIGAASSTIVSAFNGKSTIGVYPHFGMDGTIPEVLRQSKGSEIARWTPTDIPVNDILDYIYNKVAYPHNLPVTPEDLAIEQAITRQTLRTLVKRISYSFPSKDSQFRSGIIPWFEPILVAGSVITKTVPDQCMMIILDGLQPTGITTILIDQNNLVSALGSSVEINPTLAVQVLGSNTVLNLGTVVAPIGSARIGTSILQGQISYTDGRESLFDVKFGTIHVIPLSLGEKATLKLQPLHRFDVGMGVGRGGTVQVTGSKLGIVFDARGRPLSFYNEPARWRSQYNQWLRILGNQ